MYRKNAFVSQHNERSYRASIFLGVTAVVLTGLVSIGSLAFVSYRMGKRQTVVAETKVPPGPTTTSSSEAPPTPASPEPPIEEDDSTPAPTSYAASLEARPAWSLDPSFAPQPMQPLAVFVQSAPFSGELDNAYVICRFQSFNKHDSFAGDDLHVRAKLGTMPQMTADGPEDANLGFVGAPLVTLKKRDHLSFEVYDRDVFGMETISKPTTELATPFNYADDGAAIECRTLAGAALRSTVKSYSTKADVAIARLAKEHVDPYSPEWTAEPQGQSKAQGATSDVAALLGWADPRTRIRVAGIEAAMKAQDAQRAQVFATLHEAARDRVTFDRFDVKLGKVDCEGSTCAIRLSVTNHGHEPMHFGSFLSPFAYVADAHSRPVKTNGGGEIAGQATAEIAVTSTGPQLASGPSIVGICQGSRCAPLRVR